MTDPTPQTTTPTRDEAVQSPLDIAMDALFDVRRAIFNADPAVLTDTLWMPEDTYKGGTVVDFIENAMERVRSLASAPAPASGMDAVLNLYREAVRIDVKMEGPQFMGANSSALKRAWEADRASLSPAATPGLAMPSREWMRDKIAADPDVEDCGAVPAATPVSEAGGEHDARLSEHPAFQAPAGMPGVEEIARAIADNSGWRDAEPDARNAAYYLRLARVILALFAPILAEKERATVKRISDVASAVAAQAGVGASETAGLIVSVLAANPEQTERFMAEGSELFIDGTIRPENGCLTHMAMNGQVVSPTRLRMMKGQSQ